MRLTTLLSASLYLFVPTAFLSTTYLYLYPVFLLYSFPLPLSVTSPTTSWLDTLARHLPVDIPSFKQERAPFRLLTIGDPQLEGDTSIPTTWLGHFPNLFDMLDDILFIAEYPSLRLRLAAAAHRAVDVIFEDFPNEMMSIRKRIDLFGNDRYLAHVYRTMQWWADPTHVTVLGDLMGSQWIDDAEFRKRGERFWKTVFKGAERVPDDEAKHPASEYEVSGYLGRKKAGDGDMWKKRIINVAGNHDIGYAGDLTKERMQRFEWMFGKANYELRFELPISVLAKSDVEAEARLNASLFDEETNPESTRLAPELRIVVVNDMNLDTPAKSTKLQDDTYAFLNDVIDTASAVEFEGHMTVILTHIPLHKDAGICVDEPFFDFFDEDEGGGIKEQYMLSYDASKGFTEGMLGISADVYAANAGKGRPGFIINGHDHAGCDTYHFINQSKGSDARWEVRRYLEAKRANIPGSEGLPGLRELTVRSVMGDFGGNVGMVSGWFDEQSWEWKMEYSEGGIGKQHVFWVVHIVDFVVVVIVTVLVIDRVLRAVGLDVEGKIRGIKNIKVARSVQKDIQVKASPIRKRTWTKTPISEKMPLATIERTPSPMLIQSLTPMSPASPSAQLIPDPSVTQENIEKDDN